ncbi:translation initiation factor [Tenuifilum thalassicum]|uniref:Translation initiation factor n=1 Tax=Tenuifilum thalassicum TaxID=2590900 RepID=A0A7D4C224_9BACT|nr:translation initiation factor [Tenuifilum thalassicum]QKG81124.1 translation initiation factor [Tenuifilum thalassicum]
MDWKDKLSFAYSTNPDFKPEEEDSNEPEIVPPSSQKLIVGIERKNRGGKVVTIVKGFVGPNDELNKLGKTLKTKCGVGGSTKDGEILIQGDHRQKVASILQDLGYKVVISGK